MNCAAPGSFSSTITSQKQYNPPYPEEVPFLWAWILTIPCSAFVAGVAWYLGRLLLSSH
jgi:hypothetical protein